MRVLVVAVLLGLVLSGCIKQSPDATEATPALPPDLHAFKATYASDDCEVELDFGGPETILAADLEHAETYRLDVSIDEPADVDDYSCGLRIRTSDAPSTFHLGADLRIVRVSGPAPFQGETDGKLTDLHFAWAGSLPPLGLFWDEISKDGAVTYRLGPDETTAELEDHAGWRGLAGDRPLVDFPLLMPDLDYRPDGVLPKAVRYPAAHTDGEPLVLKRVSYTMGDPLPLVAPYPYDARTADPGQALVPSQAAGLFNMSTSFDRAIHLIRAQEDGSRWIEDGCVVGATIQNAGGNGFVDPISKVLPGTDGIRVTLTMMIGNDARWFEYAKDWSGESVVDHPLATDEENVTSEVVSSYRRHCIEPRYHLGMTWDALFADAASLRLREDVIPCTGYLHSWGHAFYTGGHDKPALDATDSLPGRAVMEAHFNGLADANHPWMTSEGTALAPDTVVSAAWTPDNGEWWRLTVPKDLVPAMDDATWRPGVDLSFDREPKDRPFRCIPSTYVAPE